jgi:hypothetical protein
MIDMAVGDEDFLDRYAGLCSRLQPVESPPGSTKAPCIVSVHHSSVQFCCNGVTGMIAA